MAGNQVTLTFAGDSKSLERTFDKVGAGVKDMARDFDRAGDDAKRFGSSVEKMNDTVDKSEGKFMGAADLLDGLGGAFGIPTEGVTNLARSFGDLAGGFTSLVGPAIAKVAAMLGLQTAATTAQAVATTEAAAAQTGLNVAMVANPIGLIIAGVAALVAGFVLLYKNSEAVRDIVSAAFEAVKAVAGPVIEGIGKAISWVTGLFGDHQQEVVDTSAAYAAMADNLRAVLEKQRNDWQSWHDKTTQLIDDIQNPLERAQDKATVTFDQIAKNLKDNTDFFAGWYADLNTLMDRGFGVLAQKLFELGPTAAKAVDEARRMSNEKLTAMTDMFGQAGIMAQEAFHSRFLTNEGLRAMGDAGVTWGAQFKKGFDYGVGGAVTVPMNRLGPAVPHLAGGGIVNRPTLALIGESGPEAVVPLGGGGGAGGGLHIHAGVIVTETQLADLVQKVLLRKQNRTGSLGFA